MLDRLEFLFTEAFTALKRNGSITVAAITTTAIALFIFGGVGLAYVSLSSYLGALQSDIAIMVPLKASLTTPEAEEMTRKAREIDGVADARFVPRDVEWRKFTSQPGKEGLRGVANPLPNQVKVVLSDLKKGDAVLDSLKRLPGYDPKRRIRDASPERERIGFLIEFVRLFGGLLSLISLATAGTLVFNTVFLTVTARKQQISTMSLVGASRATIRWPFLLEGAIQGFAGGLLAGLLLWAVVAYLSGRTSDWLGVGSGAAGGFSGLQATLILVGMGVLLGMLAAGLSVRKHLRYES